MTDQQFIAWLQGADCIRCALVEVGARIGGVESTLYLSSRNYVTGAGDTPAHTAYQACITGGVRFSESLSLDGQPSQGWGDIEIDNRGGVRDTWLNYVWAGRRVRVHIGDPRWPRAEFRLVFDGVAGDLGSSNADVLNLSLLSKLERLNVPLTEATLGGTTANKGRLLPLTIGECHNVTPLLTDPATLEYQVHAGAIEQLIEVRDNGAPVTFAPTLASGKFVLGAAPAGTITASVQGDKASAYANTVAALVQRLATGYGPASTRFTAADLDAANLSAFAAACPQPVGLHAPERTNVLAACQELAASVGAQVVVTSQGLLRLVRITLPDVPPPDLLLVGDPAPALLLDFAADVYAAHDGVGLADLSFRDDYAPELLLDFAGDVYAVHDGIYPLAIGPADMDYHGLSIEDRPPVRAAVTLAWCRNWTPQDGAGLATGLPADSADLFAQEWLTTTVADSTVAGMYKLDAAPQQEDTLLLVEADAQAEAQRRLRLWSQVRTVFSAACRAHLLLAELGDPVVLTHPRYGLQSGRSGIVLRIERDWLGGRVTLGVLC